MKLLLIAISFVSLTSFTDLAKENQAAQQLEITELAFANISLINDTKAKVSIHTGSGFVSLNKGSKTSFSCKTGKEVRWAESGKKKGLIFKITSDMCGKSIKLSDYQ